MHFYAMGTLHEQETNGDLRRNSRVSLENNRAHHVGLNGSAHVSAPVLYHPHRATVRNKMLVFAYPPDSEERKLLR
jgi:hypothetical protein